MDNVTFDSKGVCCLRFNAAYRCIDLKAYSNNVYQSAYMKI